MTTINEWSQRTRLMLEEHKELVAKTRAVYRFVLSGEEACTMVLNLSDAPSLTDGYGDGSVNCTIHLSSADFIEMVEGRVDGSQLFFSGKVRIDGDIGVALKLKKILANPALQYRA